GRRSRRDLEPDGGRGDRRDRPLPSVAVGPPWRSIERRPNRGSRSRSADDRAGAWENPAFDRRGRVRPREIPGRPRIARTSGPERRFRRIPDAARVRTNRLMRGLWQGPYGPGSVYRAAFNRSSTLIAVRVIILLGPPTDSSA